MTDVREQPRTREALHMLDTKASRALHLAKQARQFAMEVLDTPEDSDWLWEAVTLLDKEATRATRAAADLELVLRS